MIIQIGKEDKLPFMTSSGYSLINKFFSIKNNDLPECVHPNCTYCKWIINEENIMWNRKLIMFEEEEDFENICLHMNSQRYYIPCSKCFYSFLMNKVEKPFGTKSLNQAEDILIVLSSLLVKMYITSPEGISMTCLCSDCWELRNSPRFWTDYEGIPAPLKATFICEMLANLRTSNNGISNEWVDEYGEEPCMAGGNWFDEKFSFDLNGEVQMQNSIMSVWDWSPKGCQTILTPIAKYMLSVGLPLPEDLINKIIMMCTQKIWVGSFNW
jgi:hypothetical protein